MTSKNSSNTSKSSSSTSSSAAQKKSELNELTEDLNSTKPEVKKEALKKVIANMTVGKDVAPLFQAVIKCIEVNDIEIKKLVYLYIINNSRTRPDDAIMVISLFRKDIQNKTSPLLRALAARTMGCVRVKKLNDYLIDPLREALTDDDPYVKKTAILCIPKVYEISPELIEQNGIIETLNKMLEKEGNAYVISNILCALNELSAFKNKNLLNINFSNVQKLTLALNECGEWSQIYILESLATYHPNDVKESEELIDRVIPRLGHINPAVVLTAIKVIIKYMDYLTNDEHIRALCKKISPPIASLLARPPEVQYVALKNIRFLLEKQPHLLEKEIRAFFIKFNDPYYIKLEKLEILTRLCDNRNFDVVITELAEYANDVDQEFSRKSLKALAKICIKVDKAAEKCIEIIKKILSECKKALHIAHECAIVLQIVLRKFPEKFDYDPIMKEFCEFLTEMDEGEAKASLIWVIGEYAEKISNSEHLIAKAAENFLTEPACVQLQLLTATVKLYLKKPDEAEQLVQDILSLASEQNEIPDVRDRGFIYWRLLSSDPEKTKKIVLSDRPVLADDVVTFEESLLENLVNNISNVSSVYYKPPETIIPKILVDYNKDDQAADKEAEAQKAKQDSDKAKKAEEQKKNDAEEKRKEKEREKERERQAELDKKAKEEEKKQKETGKDDKKGFKGLRKPGEPIPQGGDLKTGGTKSGGVNLLDSDDEPAPVKTTSNGTSGQTGNAGNTGGGANLLDFEDEEPATNNVQSGGGLLDFDSKPQFHQVPFETVLTASNAGAKGNKGVALAARFIRENGKLILNLKLTNSAANIVKDFDSQLKPNCFGLKLEKLPGISLNPGETTEVKVNVLNTAQADSNPPPNPLLFVAGLKSSLDVFYFNTPCSFHTLLTEDGALDSKEFKRLWKETEGSDVIQELPSVNPKLKNVEKLKEHLQANNLFFLTSRVNEMSQTVAYFTAKSISGVYFLLEVNVPSSKNPNGCGLTVRTLQRPLAPLLMQAVITILSNAN